MRAGRLAGELARDRADEEAVMQLAARDPGGPA